MLKGSDCTVFFFGGHLQIADHMNLRAGCNERKTTKCLLLKMLFFSTDNGRKTMLIAR